ncbi:hypothetical protein QYE76_046358 [Lolium multiflorum]|uniref:BTB domain-containing protein n=1 Tax=Lolium multiflorum TaxID=4521 RepID=A0AAD8TMT3_LOLMU|nr:hypothetical protein QYE76_046358 [Lolium multiflorum]
MEPVIFEMLLHFVCKDLLPPCDEKVNINATAMQHLLAMADLYGLERLKAMCEQSLSKSIDAKTSSKKKTVASRLACSSISAQLTVDQRCQHGICMTQRYLHGIYIAAWCNGGRHATQFFYPHMGVTGVRCNICIPYACIRIRIL